MNPSALVLDRPRPAHTAHGLCGGEAGLQSVLMEARAEPGPGEPDVTSPLQGPQRLLRLNGAGVEHRVLVIPFAEDQRRVGFLGRVQADEQGRPGQALKLVHPVGDAAFARAFGVSQMRPGGPGLAPLGHQRDVAVQHHAVGPVFDGSQQVALLGGGGLQQLQRLIRMGGQDHGVEPLKLPVLEP